MKKATITPEIEVQEDFDRDWPIFEVRLPQNAIDTMEEMSKFGIFEHKQRMVQVILVQCCKFYEKHGHLAMLKDF